MCPAVVVGDRLERLGDSEVRPGNAYHRVKGRRAVESAVAAPLGKERTVPVGHEVTSRNAD